MDTLRLGDIAPDSTQESSAGPPEIDPLQLTDRYSVATPHDPAIQSLKPKS